MIMTIQDFCQGCVHRAKLSTMEPCWSGYFKDNSPSDALEEAPKCYVPRAKQEMPEETEDNVHHPSHYTFGSIEVIDYIRDKMTPMEFQGYCQGNVLKYVSRFRHKGGVEDLHKAHVYLCWLIDSLEKEAEADE